jgi:hypothetical protein
MGPQMGPHWPTTYGIGPTGYVLSKNRRRNLTSNQWAAILARARAPIEKEAAARSRANLKQGNTPPETAERPGR